MSNRNFFENTSYFFTIVNVLIGKSQNDNLFSILFRIFLFCESFLVNASGFFWFMGTIDFFCDRFRLFSLFMGIVHFLWLPLKAFFLLHGHHTLPMVTVEGIFPPSRASYASYGYR